MFGATAADTVTFLQLFQWDLQRAADHLLHTEGGGAEHEHEHEREQVSSLSPLLVLR
jgi:hypothetical protein